MRHYICTPTLPSTDPPGATLVSLYGRRRSPQHVGIGANLRDTLVRRRWNIPPQAWDFLSFALAVLATDQSSPRNESPDGWTRELTITIAVTDPDLWNAQGQKLEEALAYLTTDRWALTFVAGGYQNQPRQPAAPLMENSVALLSGGLDSLVGMIDLVQSGCNPIAVSQLVSGDATKQLQIAADLGRVTHLQLNHAAKCLSPGEDSQRSRTLIFLAYAVLAATVTETFQQAQTVPIYINENGYIALNPPLTPMRMGSLSTRTAHPVFLHQLQEILHAVDLNVALINPYVLRTKGEMLLDCADQTALKRWASTTTSCGRYKRFGYRHCGRCIPCQVRRAAFLAWGQQDQTTYVFTQLGQDDENHARFDDVRSVALATIAVQQNGVQRFLGASLSDQRIGSRVAMEAMVERSIKELGALHRHLNVL